MDQTEYKHLRITGNITFKRLTGLPQRLTMNIVIMGPTGAGKSSFIEALCGDTSLGISKNQLEGYTQDVTGYELINITHRDHSPICIIDTPGFADRKISEMEIVTKLNKYLDLTKARINYVLYLTPITDIRLTGSRKRIINTFKTLTGIQTSRQITIVTTMWNQLHSHDATKQAELRAKDLTINPAWKELITRNATIQKFQNTQPSALHILETAIGNSTESPYMFALNTQMSGNSAYIQNLASDLDERIQQLLHQESTIAYDLQLNAKPYSEDDDSHPLLISLLESTLAEVENDLERFGKERTQLEGIKTRWEVESLLRRVAREFNGHILKVQAQCKTHDWDTNQPFHPLAPPPDFLFLMPPAPPPVAEESHSQQDPREGVNWDPDPESLLLILSLEERAKAFQRDLDELKQHLQKPKPKPIKSSGQGPPAVHGPSSNTVTPRRNWLTSMKGWKDIRSRK